MFYIKWIGKGNILPKQKKLFKTVQLTLSGILASTTTPINAEIGASCTDLKYQQFTYKFI